MSHDLNHAAKCGVQIKSICEVQGSLLPVFSVLSGWIVAASAQVTFWHMS